MKVIPTVNEYLREFICHVEQYLNYVDGAVNGPELADFDVINEKTEQVRRQILFVEPLIGVHRKEAHEDRKNSPASKASSGAQGAPKIRARTSASATGARKTRG